MSFIEINLPRLYSLTDSPWLDMIGARMPGHEMVWGARTHYRLLCYLSTLFNNTTLIEIGTYQGSGALALSYNASNKVITYDISHYHLLSFIFNDLPKLNYAAKVECRLKEADEDILSAPFIFIDIAHTGNPERKLLDFLVKKHYNGLVLLDDIGLNSQMTSFWNDIKLPKYDLTEIGHCSGSGLVCFGGQEVILRFLN